MKESLLGYMVEASRPNDFAESVYHDVFFSKGTTRSARWLACLNPHSYVVAQRDPEFSEALKNADWLVPDGAGVLLASHVLGGQIRERITGSDIFSSLLQRMDDSLGHSVFFLGSTEDTLLKIRECLGKDYPNVRIAGTYSPPFKPNWCAEEITAMVHAINEVKPDVLWVGLTAPKQEKWIYEHLPYLDIRFAAAIGAVFDFYSGNVKRSHPFFQHIGLEWLPRLIKQPRRLWRRTFKSVPVFLWAVFKEKIKLNIG